MNESKRNIADSWRVVEGSVMGASHVAKDLPNQDAVKADVREDRLILATADGHGSAPYFFSERGSQFAVEACVEELNCFYENVCKRPEYTDYSLEREFKKKVPRNILQRWREKVAADWKTLGQTPLELRVNLVTFLQTRPQLTEKLIHTLVYDAEPDKPRFEAYGATALAALTTPEHIFFLQLGDGDILEADSGLKFSAVMPEDAGNFANETRSLCASNAIRHFRVRFKPLLKTNVPSAITLSSDGLANSFSDDRTFFNCLKKDILANARNHGTEVIRQALENFLNFASQNGSGDDVTFGIVFNRSYFGDKGPGSTPIVEIPEYVPPKPIVPAPKKVPSPPNVPAENVSPTPPAKSVYVEAAAPPRQNASVRPQPTETPTRENGAQRTPEAPQRGISLQKTTETPARERVAQRTPEVKTENVPIRTTETKTENVLATTPETTPENVAPRTSAEVMTEFVTRKTPKTPNEPPPSERDSFAVPSFNVNDENFRAPRAQDDQNHEQTKESEA